LIFILPAILTAFSGTIVDAKSGKPVKNAMISDTTQIVRSDTNGSFTIDNSKDTLHIKAYGYRALAIDSNAGKSIFELRPLKVKAFYVNFYAANPDSKAFKKIFRQLGSTEMNAVVVDIKNVKGNLTYKTNFKEANKIGASKSRSIKDISSFISQLHSKDIYTIARIAVFKDTRQAKHFPDRAVKTPGGHIWWDKHHTAWIDPFSKKGQDYTLAIAEDAAKAGFDEINFDYIRFPAHKGLRYKKANTEKNRIAAIQGFLKLAQERLFPYNTYISVDIFGYVAWNNDDTQIGQTVPSLAKYSDYVCPMLYPSGFHRGTLGYSDPTKHPYTIVKASTKKAHNKGLEYIRIRPWLQSFRDYAYSHVNYTEYQIARQIQAANDTGTDGWFLWNPSSRYTYVNKKMFSIVHSSHRTSRDKADKTTKHRKKKHRKSAKKKKSEDLLGSF